MSLKALKLTKENLPTIARTIGINPEALSLLAATRDRYILWEPETLGSRHWSMISEVIFHNSLVFKEPESNQFIDVITK